MIEAKALVKHGEWHDWIKANCTISDAKAQRVADLSIREAIRELRKPKDKESESAINWLPTGDVIAQVFFETHKSWADQPCLVVQESSNKGFYYMAFVTFGEINFTIKPIHRDYVEYVIFEWLPGMYTRNCSVQKLDWKFSKRVMGWVKNVIIDGFLPDSYQHLKNTANET